MGSPLTANTWLKILKTVVNGFVGTYEFAKNPIVGIEPFDTRGHRTYTVEAPNALRPDELGDFLATMRELHPQFFAFTYLGFITGLRPSSMRPLRRKGPNADVLWDDGVILIRRSQTRGDEVMEMTKTDLDQRLALPGSVMDVLRWHAERFPWSRQHAADLLFPSRTGGFMAPSALDKPFHEVAEAMKLGKKITPRGMRRTFNDLARHAKIDVTVTMAVSGHQTEEMREHYSTVTPVEMRESLAKVVSLIDFRRNVSGGDHRGDHALKTTSAGSSACS